MTTVNDAVVRICEVLDADVLHDRAYRLAVQWPSLAAALADLVTASDRRPPRALRHAQRIVNQEKEVR